LLNLESQSLTSKTPGESSFLGVADMPGSMLNLIDKGKRSLTVGESVQLLMRPER
jgi:hypothetical protein